MKATLQLIIFVAIFLFLENFFVPGQGAVIYDSLIPDNSSCTVHNGFGCLCETVKDCDEAQHLECIDNKCFCMYPLHRTFDNKLQKCVSLVESICDPGTEAETGLPRCARNSVCENGRCVCQEGYTPTSTLTCAIGHGLECGPFQCNVEAGLACKSGICTCLDSAYIYSAVTRKCFDPEAFLKNLLTTWFDRTFFRDVIMHKVFKMFRRIFGILKSPLRWLRRIRLFG